MGGPKFYDTGTMDGARFENFLTTTLLPILQPLIENQFGARLVFLPHSPDLNPAEEVFSEVKSIMKQNNALFQVTTNPRFLLATD